MIGRTLSHPRMFWQSARRLLVVLLCMAAPLLPAEAAIQEFTIFATAEDRSEQRAREQALDYAKKRAIYLAVRKLGIADPSSVAARVAQKDMAQVVRGATLVDTRRVDEKTYAKVSVSIADEGIRRALDMKAAPATGAPQKMRNVLVLPVLVTPEKTHIWSKENLLRTPLAMELMRQSHGMVILPGGDLQDLRLIDAENVRTVTAAEMKPMFTRYGVDEIIIALATPAAEGTAAPTKVTLRRLSPLSPRDESLDLPPAQATDNAAARLAAAAHGIASVATEIATSTADTERARLAGAKIVKLRLAYAIPREIAAIQEAVRSAPGVLLLELPNIALHDVSGKIHIAGDIAAVRDHLRKRGIIVRGGDTDWTLSTR